MSYCLIIYAVFARGKTRTINDNLDDHNGTQQLSEVQALCVVLNSSLLEM